MTYANYIIRYIVLVDANPTPLGCPYLMIKKPISVLERHLLQPRGLVAYTRQWIYTKLAKPYNQQLNFPTFHSYIFSPRLISAVYVRPHLVSARFGCAAAWPLTASRSSTHMIEIVPSLSCISYRALSVLWWYRDSALNALFWLYHP